MVLIPDKHFLPGPNVIKNSVICAFFCKKPECLLDQARKACQALELITKVLKVRTKKFYNKGPWLNVNG
jgi:hypothetical protein